MPGTLGRCVTVYRPLCRYHGGGRKPEKRTAGSLCPGLARFLSLDGRGIEHFGPGGRNEGVYYLVEVAV